MASTYEAYILSLLAGLAIPVTATPISTVTNGTTGAGTTETFDTVLGFYQCNLIAGRRYLAIMNGLVGNGGAVADSYSVQLRNSGAPANPTSASTLVAQSEWYCPAVGSAGRGSIPLAGSFIAPANGINTFGLSYFRIAGTQNFTPVSPSLTGAVRELYVMYLGLV